jgi:uncharacterized RDD family membrane protein YckC
VRLGQSYTLNAGEEVPGIVVIWGDVVIDGHVSDDVVNVLGNLRLGPAARVDGAVVEVGGNVTAAATTVVRQDMVVVGGGIDAPPEFSPGGDHVIVGSPSMGNAMRRVSPWFTHGLLWGRVITPGVGWVWWFVFVFLLIYVAIAVAFPKAVAASAATLAARPISAFFTGMLTLLLVGPVTALLAVSLIGVIVVPFVFCALLAAWMLGKTAVMRWMGAGIAHEDAEVPFHALRSVLIGFALVTVTYMIPVLGLAAWALVGMIGLGTAVLTALTTLKRERPARPPKPVAPPAAPGPSGAAPGDRPTMPPAVPPAMAFSTPGPDVITASAPLPGGSAPALPLPAAVPRGAAAPGVDLRTMPRATFLDRFFAGILDALLVGIVYRVIRPYWWDESTFFFMLLIYLIAFWAWKGTTIGSIICNLRIIRTDGAPLKPVDALVRGLSSLFSAAALGLGYFYIAMDSNPQRQAWHDKIAGTLVVRVPKDWPVE